MVLDPTESQSRFTFDPSHFNCDIVQSLKLDKIVFEKLDSFEKFSNNCVGFNSKVLNQI